MPHEWEFFNEITDNDTGVTTTTWRCKDCALKAYGDAERDSHTEPCPAR